MSLFLVGSPITSSATEVPPYRHFEGVTTSAEDRLFADAGDGRLDEHTLWEAALVAGGCPRPEQLDARRRQLDTHVAELLRRSTTGLSTRRRAEALLDYMHTRIMTGGYQLSANDPALLLASGQFNCVSATVLFYCLGTRLGLDVRAVEVPGHAFCRVVIPDGTIDVETTCPQWFRLVDDPKKRAEVLEKVTRARPGEPRRDAPPREVAPVQLVAMIYYNRGIDHLGRKQWSEAVAANAKALRLDPANVTARDNLAAILNNWAISEASAGRHDEAARLLARGIAALPDFATFYRNRPHVYRGWMRRLLESGDVDAALAVARTANATLRPADDWPAIQTEEIRRCAAVWGDLARWRDAAALLDRALAVQPDNAVWTRQREQVARQSALATQPSPASSAIAPPEGEVWTSAARQTVE